MPRPALSLWNDGTGFGLELEFVEPAGGGALGELWLGVDLNATRSGGASATVVPLLRVPVLLTTVAEGVLSASVRLPDALAVAAMDFYAQGVVHGGTVLGVRMTEPVPVGFEGAVALPSCPRSSGSVSQSTATNGDVRLVAGFTTVELIQTFEGTDGVLASAAYRELFERGVASIEPLLAVASQASSATALWSSVNTFEARSSSFVRFDGGEPISVRRMALFLISAIAMGVETPYAVNALHDADFASRPASELEALALENVLAWWTANEGRTLEQLHQRPRPLFAAEVDFGVAQGRHDPLALFPAGVGLEDAQPGSSTYLALGAAQAVAHAGDQTFLAALVETKKDPYNCLSWSVHCDMCHGWVQPCKPSGGAIDDWMRMNGWSTTPPAGGASKTTVIQKHNDSMGNSTWVHAMKKNADCSYSSKNGGGMFYPSFPDPECFGNMHYPPPAGSTSSFQTWYK